MFIFAVCIILLCLFHPLLLVNLEDLVDPIIQQLLLLPIFSCNVHASKPEVQYLQADLGNQ